ncbi:MAG: hypothetical protein WCC32_14855 [Terriglobales bacterium]
MIDMRLFLTLFLLASCAVGRADTVVKTHSVITDTGAAPNVQSPSEHRDVRYRRGAMRRKDSLGDGEAALISNIANCDTKTGSLIDLKAREYRTYKVVRFWPIAQLDDYLQKNPHDAVQIESKTIETGERKMFFNHSAKHFITTTRRSPDEKDAGGEETIDGWYIEHEAPDNNCAPDFVRSEPYYVVGTALVMPPQIAQFHHTGPVPSGLAVKLTVIHKIKGSKGTPDRILTTEETVEELSDSPLNPSLFELPPGFSENSHLLGGR